MYAAAFDGQRALDKLEAFASFNGPDFYGLPRPTETVCLDAETWTVPAHYPYAHGKLIPVNAGQQMHWKLRVEDVPAAKRQKTASQ